MHGAGPKLARTGADDLESEMLNVSPQPPQRTGVETAEDKTGPQTQYGVEHSLRHWRKQDSSLSLPSTRYPRQQEPRTLRAWTKQDPRLSYQARKWRAVCELDGDAGARRICYPITTKRETHTLRT